MRALTTVIALAASGLGAVSSAQQSLFLTLRPDVFVMVQEATGSELVEIRTTKADYPTELLMAQIDRLSQLLGQQATIEYVQRTADRTLAARIGIAGIIDKEGERYRLAPLAKAFAGAPSPFTVEGIHITLNGEKGFKGDVGRYVKDGAFIVEALRSEGGPLPMLEYRIRLLSQNPRDLDVPEKFEPPKSGANGQEGQTSTALFYVLLGVTAAAAGVLVYLALLRVSPRKR